MKRKILVVAAVFATSMAFGQDLTSKKGETMLPEEGDYAIGFDAAPFLNYVGNFLNSGATSPTADWVTTDMSIVGKMYKDASTAYRGRVRLGFGSSNTEILTDTSSNPFEEVLLVDNSKSSYNQITLGGGMEMRRGNTRIQGMYGGEALISLGSSSTTMEYQQPVSDQNPATRLLSTKSGSNFGFGLRGFAGVSLFIFPKTAIEFEYGWGLGLNTMGAGETVTETWGTAPNETAPSRKEIVNVTAKASSFGIDTDNSGARLNIVFHF